MERETKAILTIKRFKRRVTIYLEAIDLALCGPSLRKNTTLRSDKAHKLNAVYKRQLLRVVFYL